MILYTYTVFTNLLQTFHMHNFQIKTFCPKVDMSFIHVTSYILGHMGSFKVDFKY